MFWYIKLHRDLSFHFRNSLDIAKNHKVEFYTYEFQAVLNIKQHKFLWKLLATRTTIHTTRATESFS